MNISVALIDSLETVILEHLARPVVVHGTFQQLFDLASFDGLLDPEDVIEKVRHAVEVAEELVPEPSFVFVPAALR